MSKPLSPDREREFQELLAFVDFYMTYVHRIDRSSEVHVSSVCENIVHAHGKSKALEGLRQATNDIIEDLSSRPSGGIEALDDALRLAGIVTASEVRRRYASLYKRIVKRGTIRNDTEYYLVHGIVIDLGNATPDNDRAMLQQLLDSYEVGVGLNRQHMGGRPQI